MHTIEKAEPKKKESDLLNQRRKATLHTVLKVKPKKKENDLLKKQPASFHKSNLLRSKVLTHMGHILV